MGGGEQAAEVGVALAGLGEEHQVVRIGGGGPVRRAAAGGRIAPSGPASPASSDSTRTSAPKMGLMPALGAGLGEAHRAVEAVVVGEGQGRLPQLGRPGDQLLDAAAAVEEREVGVDVQVDEVVGTAGARSRRQGGGGAAARVGAESGPESCRPGGAGHRDRAAAIDRCRCRSVPDRRARRSAPRSAVRGVAGSRSAL